MTPNKFRVIGLTGTIASGKSTVSRYLRDHYHAMHIDADLVARRVVEESAQLLAWHFGQEILKDGTVDRKALGSIVFSDEQKLKLLNSLVHPETCRRIGEMIEDCRHEASEPLTLVVVEAIELVTTPLKDMVDTIWVVYADPEIRISRMMKERSLSREEAESRISSQWDDETYLSFAHQVIRSGRGSLEELYRQVDLAVENLQ